MEARQTSSLVAHLVEISQLIHIQSAFELYRVSQTTSKQLDFGRW